MPRLFVAAWPDDELRRRLERLPRPADDGVRWVSPTNWHITLRFLGNADVDDVRARLARASLPSAQLRLGPLVDRLGRRILMLPVTGADELATAVWSATEGIGRRSDHPFRGHLTLARTRPGATSAVLGAEFDAELTVDEVAVVESEPSPDGPSYRTVATFPTGDGTTGRP